MRRTSAWLKPFVFAAGVVALSPFAHHGLAELGRLRKAQPVTCLGRAGAPLRIVYLHGSDSYGPSWVELKNRETIHALAKTLDARVALPRARGGWPQRDTESLDATEGVIRDAAGACFGERATFGLLGFSDGGNAANQLYLRCRSLSAAWIVSVGSEASLPLTQRIPRSGCAPIALVVGRHEPTYPVARGFAQQLRKRGARVRLVEHAGVHELPFSATRDALVWVRER